MKEKVLKKNKQFKIAGSIIEPGERKLVELKAASLYLQVPINIPVYIINGKKVGKRIFITAAVHGNEINGIEILRRLLILPALKTIKGTIIAVPVANIHGLVTLSRDLPDRRDLNRAFPGSKKGSLTSRIANLFMNEIIKKCDYGIDLHTGGIHLENLPHIRINTRLPEAVKMARAFNVPIILDAKLRDGSIRQAAGSYKIPVIVYEGGEALRFDEVAIRVGMHGILNVLQDLGMIKKFKIIKKKIKPRLSFYSSWIRSPASGIFHPMRKLGNDIDKGEKLGIITNPFSQKEIEVYSRLHGVIIGKNTLPIVNQGDALFHIAQYKNSARVASTVNELENYYIEHPYDYT